MKFKTDLDQAYFEALEIDESIIRNKLKFLLQNIKNRRKSLQMKNFWRRNAYQMKKAINKWHQSTQGKRFHRNLGNFLATHLTRKDLGLISTIKKESLDIENREIDISLDAVTDILLGLNSIKTHLILELYYFERDSEALEEFLEIFFQFIEEQSKIEPELLRAYISGKLNINILLNIIGIFIFFIDPKQFLYEVRQINNLSNDINQDSSLNEDFKLLKNDDKYQIIFDILEKYQKDMYET